MQQHQLGQCLGDQARLAGAGDAGHRREHTQRHAYVHAVQVMTSDGLQLQPAGGCAGASAGGGQLVEQVAGGVRFGHFAQARRGTAVEHAAAALTGIGTDIHQPLGAAHQFQIMLDHEHRVAGVAQAVEGVVKRLAVGRVQAG